MPNFHVKPLHATFGAIVANIQLAELHERNFDALYRVWLDYALLMFPGQNLSAEAQLEFSLRFGELEFPIETVTNLDATGTPRDDPDDEVMKVLRGNEGWHCDSTYMPIQSKCAVFCVQAMPSHGGGTAWADMRAGYDVLNDQMKERIAPLHAYHSLRHSQAKIGHVYNDDDEHRDYDGYGMGVEPPLRSLVKIHPETGRTTLMIGRPAVGAPTLTKTHSEELFSRLTEQVCQPPRVYEHVWSVGDVAVWDNRSLMHRARPYDMREPRIIRNCRIVGDADTEYATHA